MGTVVSIAVLLLIYKAVMFYIRLQQKQLRLHNKRLAEKMRNFDPGTPESPQQD